MLNNADQNNPDLWNYLLSNKDYVDDQNWTVIQRIKNIYSNVVNSKRILNIGAGQGYFEKRYARKLRTEYYVNCDISIKGLRRFSIYENIRCVNCSITNLPFKSGEFDCVICTEVLEHLSKLCLKTALNEIKRVLGKSSKVIFSVPVYEPISLINHPVGHLRKFTPEEFKADITNNGFRVVAEKKYFSFRKFPNIFSRLNKIIGLRRPSIYQVVCEKS